jgi:hypothetical protein
MTLVLQRPMRVLDLVQWLARHCLLAGTGRRTLERWTLKPWTGVAKSWVGWFAGAEVSMWPDQMTTSAVNTTTVRDRLPTGRDRSPFHSLLLCQPQLICGLRIRVVSYYLPVLSAKHTQGPAKPFSRVIDNPEREVTTDYSRYFGSEW